MPTEGGLRQPERPPLPLKEPAFWDAEALDEEMRRQFDVCHGCRRCFNLCDSFPRLFDLIDESETLELDSVESSGFRGVVDACTLCDMCFMVSCPYVPPHDFAIDIPKLFLRARAIDFRAGRVSRTDREVARVERNGRLARWFAGLVNRLNRVPVFRVVLEKLAGIDRRAELPRYTATPLDRRTFPGPETTTRRAVVYATCFANYNAPSIGEAALSVLARNGVDAEVIHPDCCGMPQLEHGDVDTVQHRARTVARAFRPHIEAGRTVITLTPSCALMLKSEWPGLLPDDEDVRLLAGHTRDIDEYVVDIARTEGLADGLAPLEGGITLHLACHSRAQNIGPKSAQMLRQIPDTEVQVIERCSGHGGTWGVRKEWFDTAIKVGKPVVREASRTNHRHLASACPLAGMHIGQAMAFAGHADTPECRHPIELLEESYRSGEQP